VQIYDSSVYSLAPCRQSQSRVASSELVLSQKEQIINPGESWETKGNCITSLTLGYLTPLLLKGASATVLEADVGNVAQKDRAEECFSSWERIWADEVSNGKGGPDVMRAQMRMVGRGNLAIAIGFYIVSAAIQFIPVFILNILVQHFSGTGWTNLTFGTLMVMAAALLVFPVIGSICQTKHDVMMLHFGLRARTAVAVAIYRHALRLTSAARQGVSTGEVVNLFSNDALKVELFMKFMAFMVVAPVQVRLSVCSGTTHG
jgi:ATP-binding cassette, subfamily C (CFTR/MRP), member 4